MMTSITSGADIPSEGNCKDEGCTCWGGRLAAAIGTGTATRWVSEFTKSRCVHVKFVAKSTATWPAGWLAGLLAGWLACWLAGLLAGWLAGWQAGWLVRWLAGCLAGWGWLGLCCHINCNLAGLLAGWLACWLAGWLAGRLAC